MKLWTIEQLDCGNEHYGGVVVVAESKEQAVDVFIASTLAPKMENLKLGWRAQMTGGLPETIREYLLAQEWDEVALDVPGVAYCDWGCDD